MRKKLLLVTCLSLTIFSMLLVAPLVQPSEAGFNDEGCYAGCDTDYNSDIAACSTNHTGGTPAYTGCVERAKLERFLCKHECFPPPP